jgi:hypothetical protein
VRVLDPEGIEEGPFKLPFRIGTIVEDWAAEPRPEEPCANGGIGREGSAIDVLDFGMNRMIWVAELLDRDAGGFIGSEGL